MEVGFDKVVANIAIGVERCLHPVRISLLSLPKDILIRDWTTMSVDERHPRIEQPHERVCARKHLVLQPLRVQPAHRLGVSFIGETAHPRLEERAI
jgi:hypothetical protein